MCKYCEPNESGNLVWLRDEPDNSAYLEEYNSEWGIVAFVTSMCCGRECESEIYIQVKNCPMCGRRLGGDA